MSIQKIYIGGWFQRTTLHLSEIYDFLEDGYTPLKLDPKKLKQNRNNLKIKSLSKQVDSLEFIHLVTKTGINVKFYEDGLIVLSKDAVGDMSDDFKVLTDFYEGPLAKGLSYVFSLGAPVPKELANVETIYPYFVVLKNASASDISGIIEKDFKEGKYLEVKRDKFEIYRGDRLYIIKNKSEELENIEQFVHEQIFIREFKTQLHRYLNLHRIIWEKIAEVKERGKIKGREIIDFKSKIESYAKTISLIDSRIDQMGSYVRTREAIVKNNTGLADFSKVLDYRHETLVDTLSYVKGIWKMTREYVDSALKLFGDLQDQSTQTSVENLTIVTSMGVGATLIGLFTSEAPSLTWFGAWYFVALAVIGYLSSQAIGWFYARKSYEIEDVELAKNIK